MYKRFLPKKSSLSQTQKSWIGHKIHDPNLWRFSCQPVASGVAIGLFAAFIPLPIQMMFAIIFCALFRANIPIAISCTWITNPITFIPINYFIHDFGEYILNIKHETIRLEPIVLDAGVENVYESLVNWANVLGKPFIVGLPIVAITVSITGYLLIITFWHVMQMFKKNCKKDK